MVTVNRAEVLAFIQWLADSHPEVRTLRELSRGELLKLVDGYAAAFSQGKSLLPHERKAWGHAIDIMRKATSSVEGLKRL